ncbi:MAG: hypothetical protein J3T61_00075 [Candidatus Brocadiales bacterium]|nr:hypothetical protein [Candidatus Bathyanammoxibius sp.]
MKIRVGAPWRDAIERALRGCKTVAAVNGLSKCNKMGMADYAERYPDKVRSLDTLFANKRAELAQAPLGE